MELSSATRDELLANYPSLRKFALSLCGTIDGEDDMVLAMLLRALSRAEYLR
jgi:DNA-directed RNA polymerase specialized sigma24 family protein